MLWKLTNFLLHDEISQEIKRAKHISRNGAFLPKNATTVTKYKSECVPVMLTYNAALRSISFIIRKRLSILTSSRRWHNIFKSAPIVAFRCTNNCGNLLVRAIMQPFTKLHTSPLRAYFQHGSHYSTLAYISNRLTFYTFQKTYYSPRYLQL